MRALGGAAEFWEVTEKVKLLLVISSLGLGGAERAVSILAREWVRHGHQVALATLEESGSIAAYDLPQELNRIYLGRGAAGLSSLRKLPRLLRIVRRIRRTVRAERPDIVVSFMDQTNVLTILGTLGLKVPCIVNEQIHPSFSSIEKFPALPLLSWFLIPLRNFSYRGARWITLLSERSRNCFPGYLQARIRVISNPVAELPAEARDAELPRPVVLGVGRLVPQKRFDRLIEAFALLAPQFPEWSLALAGEGRDRETLMRLADRLGVSSKVQFLGRRQAMGSLFKSGRYFCALLRLRRLPQCAWRGHGLWVCCDCDGLSYGPWGAYSP